MTLRLDYLRQRFER